MESIEHMVSLSALKKELEKRKQYKKPLDGDRNELRNRRNGLKVIRLNL